jgi:hypothetical protein
MSRLNNLFNSPAIFFFFWTLLSCSSSWAISLFASSSPWSAAFWNHSTAFALSLRKPGFPYTRRQGCTESQHFFDRQPFDTILSPRHSHVAHLDLPDTNIQCCADFLYILDQQTSDTTPRPDRSPGVHLGHSSTSWRCCAEPPHSTKSILGPEVIP